jgi:3-phosphoinositide dependent protein kinase-1
LDPYRSAQITNETSQRDKHLTFEDPRATTSDPAGSKYSTQEWLDSVEQAREIALSQSASSSYVGDVNGMNMNGMNSDMNMDMDSPVESLGGDSAMPMSGPSTVVHSGRQTLRKEKDDGDGSGKGRKRFSKRHSKSGLAAVF